MESWLKTVTYYHNRLDLEMQGELMQYICYVKLRSIEMDRIPASLQELEKAVEEACVMVKPHHVCT